MGSYTEEDVLKAYLFYMENNGNLSRTARVTGIPLSTLNLWKKENDWDKKVEEDSNVLDLIPYKNSAAVEKLVESFDLSKNDAELLNQVKKVESVCFAVIEKKDKELVNIGLKPETFDQAIRALKVCWDTREKIFSKRDVKKDSENGEKKVNYIGAVIQNFGGKGEGNIPEEPDVVHGEPIDIKRGRDNTFK